MRFSRKFRFGFWMELQNKFAIENTNENKFPWEKEKEDRSRATASEQKNEMHGKQNWASETFMNLLDLLCYISPFHVREHAKSNGSQQPTTQMWECRLSNNWWHWLCARDTRRRARTHLKWQAVTPLAATCSLCERCRNQTRDEATCEHIVCVYLYGRLDSSFETYFGGARQLFVCLFISNAATRKVTIILAFIQNAGNEKNRFKRCDFLLREQLNCTSLHRSTTHKNIEHIHKINNSQSVGCVQRVNRSLSHNGV